LIEKDDSKVPDAYVFNTRKAALLMIAKHLKNVDLEDKIHSASADVHQNEIDLDDIEDNYIDWDGLCIQIQTMNNPNPPYIPW
jgi:hypothetical protein